MLKMVLGFSALVGGVIQATPEQLIPTDEGMAWKYKMTEQAGPGLRLNDGADYPAGKLTAPVLYRIQGTRDLGGKTVLEFEMHRGGRLINTDLMTVDERGIECWARIDEFGQLTTLDPPQAIVASPIEVGTAWNFNGLLAGEKVHQHYEVIGEGDITTAAGQFQGFHIRGDQDAPGPMTIDRWFVPGVGIVKDVTETKSDSGELLRRISLELIDPPKIASRPPIKFRPEDKPLTVSLGQGAVGESRTLFFPMMPKICARWQGHNLRDQAKIRVRWVAENVEGVTPPDYTIDEATTIATSPDSHGVFTLARPDDGWAIGAYRVEFYVDSRFADAVHLKIASPPATKF